MSSWDSSRLQKKIAFLIIKLLKFVSVIAFKSNRFFQTFIWLRAFAPFFSSRGLRGNESEFRQRKTCEQQVFFLENKTKTHCMYASHPGNIVSYLLSKIYASFWLFFSWLLHLLMCWCHKALCKFELNVLIVRKVWAHVTISLPTDGEWTFLVWMTAQRTLQHKPAFTHSCMQTVTFSKKWPDSQSITCF